MDDWQRRAAACLAGGVSSQFRARDPVVFSHGAGSHVWDIDNNEFIDYTLSQGPMIHGHSHPEILRAVQAALSRGQVWPGLHTDEIELAEELVQIIPCCDLVRLGCTGSEMVHAALRLARAATGRAKIIKFEGHYHGWLDSVAGSIAGSLDELGERNAPRPVPWTAGIQPGVLDDLIVLPWNDAELLQSTVTRFHADIAALLTEPCMCNSGCIEPQPGYLALMRELCDRYEITLIFDEVITGFRLALGGAQEYYGTMPDLAIFAKAAASGFPLSFLAGRRPWMELVGQGEVIHAGTLNAQTAGVAAARATLRLFQPDCHQELYRKARSLWAGLREVARKTDTSIRITGPGPAFHLGFPREGIVWDIPRDHRAMLQSYDAAKYTQFVRCMARNGVRLIGRGIWYLSTALSDHDIAQTIQAAERSLNEMSETG